MNDALYEIASFMVMRESIFWRWSHIRHHSDTLVVGRDPRDHRPAPAAITRQVIATFFGLPGYPVYFRAIVRHALGRVSPEDREIVPESEFPGLFLRARIYVTIYAAVLGVTLATRSVLPLLLVGLTPVFGTWLMVVYGYTQHAGLAENVLDHRLNCRTVLMSRLHRYLYWNMGWHIEHHMFPTVPVPRVAPAPRGGEGRHAGALPRPPRRLEGDRPGDAAARCGDPGHFVRRELPAPSAARGGPVRVAAQPDAEGWVDAGTAATLPPLGTVRLDVGQRTFAVARDAAGALFATDGVCTHGNAHLADGLVKDDSVECAQAQRTLPAARRLAGPGAGLPRPGHLSGRASAGGRVLVNVAAPRRRRARGRR